MKPVKVVKFATDITQRKLQNAFCTTASVDRATRANLLCIELTSRGFRIHCSDHQAFHFDPSGRRRKRHGHRYLRNSLQQGMRPPTRSAKA